MNAFRQPLPVDVAKLIANALATDVGSVLGAAGLVTYKTGPIYRRAVPPDLLRGDLISASSLGRTVPVMSQPRSSVVAMVCGHLMGGDGVHDGVAFIDRALGVVANVAIPGLVRPAELTFGPDGLVYVFGSSGGGDNAASMAVVQQAPVLVTNVASPLTPSAQGVAYEETTNTLWVASDRAHGLVRVHSLDPLVATSFPLTIAGNSAHPFEVIAHGGFVYVTVAPPSNPGGVLKIDPNTGATVQEWRGMGSPFGIANDGPTILVTSGSDLWAIHGSADTPDLLDFAGPAIHSGGVVTHFGGAFWFTSTGVSPAGSRITRVTVEDTTAIIHADLTLAGTSGSAGYVAADLDGFIWTTVPLDGQVRILDPTAITGDPTVHTFDVGGAPNGILIL